MKIKLLFLLSFIIVYNVPSNAQFKDLFSKAKKTLLGDNGDDVGLGLKEALEIGVNEAVESLSQKDGYYASPYRVLIPDEAQKVVSTVSKIPGFKNVEKDLILKMNQAAEIAVKKAGPIFLHSIKQMTFKDAMNILMGESNSATNYLDSTSRKPLYDEFMPIIQASLDEVHAREYWRSAVDAYNKIPFRRDLNPELDDHVNNATLNGVFSLIEIKEQGIRSDIDQRTSPLLKEIFAKQDDR